MRFLRQDKGKKKLKKKWRKPKGLQSKLRRRIKGHGKVPKIGYKKGEKKKEKIIRNLKDVDFVKKDETGVVSKNVGAKKKIEILKKVMEVGVKLNIDVEKEIKRLEKKFRERKKEEKIKEKEEEKILDKKEKEEKFKRKDIKNEIEQKEKHNS